MKNTVICLLLFGISLTASAQEKVETVSMRYETQNDMPLFYQKMKENLTYPMAWGNSAIRNFEKWREEARKTLLDCMLPAPPATAFDKEVIDTEQRNDIGRRRFCSVFRNILVFPLICWFLTGMARSRQYCCFTITVRIFR